MIDENKDKTKTLSKKRTFAQTRLPRTQVFVEMSPKKLRFSTSKSYMFRSISGVRRIWHGLILKSQKVLKKVHFLEEDAFSNTTTSQSAFLKCGVQKKDVFIHENDGKLSQKLLMKSNPVYRSHKKSTTKNNKNFETPK